MNLNEARQIVIADQRDSLDEPMTDEEIIEHVRNTISVTGGFGTAQLENDGSEVARAYAMVLGEDAWGIEDIAHSLECADCRNAARTAVAFGRRSGCRSASHSLVSRGENHFAQVRRVDS